jgi:hypothetical protein
MRNALVAAIVAALVSVGGASAATRPPTFPPGAGGEPSVAQQLYWRITALQDRVKHDEVRIASLAARRRQMTAHLLYDDRRIVRLERAVLRLERRP